MPYELPTESRPVGARLTAINTAQAFGFVRFATAFCSFFRAMTDTASRKGQHNPAAQTATADWLGMGTAATRDAGTGAGNVPLTDTGGSVPASVLGNADTSTLTPSADNVTSGQMAGDLVAAAGHSARGTFRIVGDPAETNTPNRWGEAATAEMMRRLMTPPAASLAREAYNAADRKSRWMLSWTWDAAWNGGVAAWQVAFWFRDTAGRLRNFVQAFRAGPRARRYVVDFVSNRAGDADHRFCLAEVRPVYYGGAYGAASGGVAVRLGTGGGTDPIPYMGEMDFGGGETVEAADTISESISDLAEAVSEAGEMGADDSAFSDEDDEDEGGVEGSGFPADGFLGVEDFAYGGGGEAPEDR